MRLLLGGVAIQELRAAVADFENVHSDTLAQKLTVVVTQIEAAWRDLDKYEFGTESHIALAECADIGAEMQAMVTTLEALPPVPSTAQVSHGFKDVHARMKVILRGAKKALQDAVVAGGGDDGAEVLRDAICDWHWNSPSRSEQGFALPNPKRREHDAQAVKTRKHRPGQYEIIWNVGIDADLMGLHGAASPLAVACTVLADNDLHCAQTRGTTAGIETQSVITNAKVHDQYHGPNVDSWDPVANPHQVAVFRPRRESIYACASNTVQGKRVMSNGRLNSKVYNIIRDPKSSTGREKIGQPSGRDALRVPQVW
eukprot:COSAG01_NODE_2729_length_7175_cov_4.100198_2_plen_313_part_00